MQMHNKNIDANKCTYRIENLLSHGYLCDAYYQSDRSDKRTWLYWPECTQNLCPLLHHELLDGAVLHELRNGQ